MESNSLFSSLNSLDSFSKAVSSTYGTFGDDLKFVDMADEEININKLVWWYDYIDHIRKNYFITVLYLKAGYRKLNKLAFQTTKPETQSDFHLKWSWMQPFLAAFFDAGKRIKIQQTKLVQPKCREKSCTKCLSLDTPKQIKIDDP